MSRKASSLVGLAAVTVALTATATVLWWPRDAQPVDPGLPEIPTMVKFVLDDTGLATAACPKDVGWYEDPVHGMVVDLNGADQFCLAAGPMIRTTASYSVSAWVKLAVLPDGLTMTAVGQDGTFASGFYLQYSWYHRKWAFNWMEADKVDPVHNVTATSQEPVTTDWTHLVGTYDATTKQIQVYVNGVPGTPWTIGTPWQATGPLTIGRGKWNGDIGNGLHGQIGDVRMWTRTLKPDEVIQLRDATTRLS